ncbi:MAG: exopolyphosphatase [Chromatiales bacterium]|nr:exopolyphosphatase [Chromatiales bacterium]
MASQFLAAVDLGSNSFHMIVAELVDGELRIVDRLREMVRLAGGLDEQGNLDEASRQRALACLQRFGQRLVDFPPGSVRAVGTNTLRRARSNDFLKQARQALGHPIEIIAGVEEARLIYLGVAHTLSDSDDIRLVADIGGGSTEVILGRRFEALEKESLYMGCVSFTRRFFPDGAINAVAMRKAVIAARQEVLGIEREYRDIGWGQAVGASGTIKAVRDVVRANGWSDEGITYDSLRRLADELVAAGHIDRVSLQGLKEERMPVICGGVAVLLALFEGLQIERMAVSEQALREGLLYDMLGRLRHEDVRERTINALSERYQLDTAQAARVEQTALQLLDGVAAEWSLEDESARQLLSWAARLHEIGLAIVHSQYHKHGAYLLANSDLPGFTRREQQLLAILVRAHRRKLPMAEFAQLPEEDGARAIRLSLLLRLAVLLHRSHSDEPLPIVEVTAAEQGTALSFPGGWIEEHPLTAADLELEQGWMQREGYRLTVGEGA